MALLTFICSLKIRKKTIYFIGSIDNRILYKKLPTLKDCTNVLFFNTKIVKINLLGSVYSVIDDCTCILRKNLEFRLKNVDFMTKFKKSYEIW